MTGLYKGTGTRSYDGKIIYAKYGDDLKIKNPINKIEYNVWRDYGGTNSITNNESYGSYWNTSSASALTSSALTYNITETVTSQQWYKLSDSDTSWYSSGPRTPVDRMREILRSRSAPAIRRSRRSLVMDVDIRESRARATLRNILGESFFRRFLRDGFITVVGKSGLTYRIHPGGHSTEVYDRGIMVERMCVILKGNFPPTDELVMRYLLILNDEEQFSEYAVRSRVSPGLVRPVKISQVKSLPEIFATMKSVA